MNKFLYMPVVLGLVLGCAGYAAGNDDNFNALSLEERAKRVTRAYDEMSANHRVTGLHVVHLGTQLTHIEQELTRLSQEYDEEVMSQIEKLKCSKRELAAEQWMDRQQGPGRFNEQQRESRLAWEDDQRQKIDDITTDLRKKGLEPILRKITEYMRINVEWREWCGKLGEYQGLLEELRIHKSKVLEELAAQRQAQEDGQERP